MRLNIRLSGSAEALLDNLARNGNMTSRDAVLDSLAILNMAVNEMQKGGRLGIQDSDGNFMAITTPSLSALAEEPDSHSEESDLHPTVTYSQSELLTN